MELTKEHIEILKHTEINGLFCGYSKEMKELCALNLMEYAGRKPFVNDSYYQLTKDGKSILKESGRIPDNG